MSLEDVYKAIGDLTFDEMKELALAIGCEAGIIGKTLTGMSEDEITDLSFADDIARAARSCLPMVETVE